MILVRRKVQRAGSGSRQMSLGQIKPSQNSHIITCLGTGAVSNHLSLLASSMHTKQPFR